MRIACIYFSTSSVGGIATHLNSLRHAAIQKDDRFDILHTKSWKTKIPTLFKNREWVRGGDTKIWVDGEISTDPSQIKNTQKWLKGNYDAICFGFICPHETKAYSTPDFLPLYDIDLPKIAWVMDGYWKEYEHWAIPLLEKLDGILCPLESYALPIRELGFPRLKISAFPFVPRTGKVEPKHKTPLLIWPNQHKNIKGITQFIDVIPNLSKNVTVELYSNGIRYYQLRTEENWKAAIGKDLFQGFNGTGRATFFGNVDIPEIAKAYQRAWFTCNLQGMKSRKETYRKGSYNNTEVEALFYGACPILHESTLQTDLPKEVYISVASAEEIPKKIDMAIKSGFALDPVRRRKARDFIINKHLASHRYQDLKELLT